MAAVREAAAEVVGIMVAEADVEKVGHTVGAEEGVATCSP